MPAQICKLPSQHRQRQLWSVYYFLCLLLVIWIMHASVFCSDQLKLKHSNLKKSTTCRDPLSLLLSLARMIVFAVAGCQVSPPRLHSQGSSPTAQHPNCKTIKSSKTSSKIFSSCMQVNFLLSRPNGQCPIGLVCHSIRDLVIEPITYFCDL